ncbi:programmed cell death protein 7-like [Planococcus citri]|uniref:programmed cell death protein 7-like n=1 Tax=Planococcus citri TaxID=170843 RepID=UPI0031F7B0C2
MSNISGSGDLSNTFYTKNNPDVRPSNGSALPSVPTPYVYPHSFVLPPFPPHTNINFANPYNYPPPPFPPPLIGGFPTFPPAYVNHPTSVAFAAGQSTSSEIISDDDFKLDKFFPEAVKKPRISSRVKLWEISRQLRSYCRMLRALEDDLEYISEERTLLDEDKVRDIVSKQERLISCKNSLCQDPTLLTCLKYKINERRKKRKYRKAKRKSKSNIHVYEIASEHMQRLEQEATRVKQDEKLKQEADTILSSVIQKKTDARYQIQLLQNLLKLHSARVHQLTVETNFTPDISITGFEKVLEKLTNLWESKIREYATEEKGLKLMIKELAVNAEDEEIKELKNTFAKWLELMFGTRDSHSDLFYSTFEQLIRIRSDWDKYVVDGNDPNGSKIPGGWVIPKYNENRSWNKFLFN